MQNLPVSIVRPTDYNAVRRDRYAAMPKEQKDAMLQRRRERYASKRGGNIPSHTPSPVVKKPKKYKSSRNRDVSATRLPLSDASADVSTIGQSSCDRCGAVSSDRLAEVFDCLSNNLQSSSSVTSSSSQPMSSSNGPHPSSNISFCFSQPSPSAAPNVSSSLSEAHIKPLVDEGTCVMSVGQSALSKHGTKSTVLVSTRVHDVNKRVQSKGSRKRPRKSPVSRLDKIPNEPMILPDAPDCEHCGAKRFHLEPPKFCCSGGEVSVVIPAMPYDLFRLFSGTDEECVEFRKNVRTYNNNLAFTSFGAKYDSELTKNTRGVYTFHVQGQVYHILNGLKSSGHPPTGIQLYFYDHEEELSKRLGSSPRLRQSTLRLLMRILGENPYTKFFKGLKEVPNLDDHKIILNFNPGLDQRVFNLPTSSQVAAIWTEDADEDLDRNAHIQVYTHSNVSHRIQHYFACYDSLQYPILFPNGEAGWHYGIPRKRDSDKRKRDDSDDDMFVDPSLIGSASQLVDIENAAAEKGKKKCETISAREYYCYKLQMRDDDRSMLLHTGRLFQQFAVDIYVKIETSRLDFHRKKQREIRTEILKGVIDSISSGHTEGGQVGKRVYLPSSFIGGPRDMKRRYIDAMALVQKYGKPDLFITMTCNTMWKEIQSHLHYQEEAQDRPDLVARIFRAKLEMLKAEIIKKKIFGEVAACVYVIEFQKRGLPHAHLLVILKPEYKPLNADAYDKIVSAEIPDPKKQQYLHSLVIRHMMHGPCGLLNPDNVCMKNGVCKNHYPKDFCECTTHSEDGYPHYRRRQSGISVTVRQRPLDNRWVVPYNPYLLALFDCHLNVEICSTVKLVKYLYKYVYKGHDRVSFHIHSDNNHEDVDEIKDFQAGRYVAAAEACWRIFRFILNEMTPSVCPLQLHLPGEQMISFHKKTNLADLLDNVDFSKTMLTQFFYMNRVNERAQNLKCLYKEFPEFFVWKPAKKRWSERKRGKVIGRLVTVNPSEGERYYLRLLLCHIRAPTSFDGLLTVNGTLMSSYREAAFHMGLLQSDTYIDDTLEEAAVFQMPSSFRALFAIMLCFCAPSNPRELWVKYEAELSRDFHRSAALTGYSFDHIRACVLREINRLLEQMGRGIADFHLTSNDLGMVDPEKITKEIESERNVQFSEEDLLLPLKLNTGQRATYEAIMSQVFSSKGQCFFVDGPGGTGKTFLYRSILAALRSQGYIVLAVASSGVAASILPGGRTAHSRFKIPLDMSEAKVCQVSKQSSTARLIMMAKLILWDEASMARKETIEAFDMLLKDIMDCDDPFGGKTVVFGGDFRQTLPVIQNATREVQVESSFVNSHLWASLQKLTLTENMRAVFDHPFSEFLLRVGEGCEFEDENGKISLCSNICIPYDTRDASLDRLISSVFSDLHTYSLDPYEMIGRCILSPTNSAVDDINETIISRFPGDSHVFTSTNRTLNERDQGDYEDFLNSLNPRGLPPHRLVLKRNCPIILLRNLNPMEGLCNGTRLICRELRHNTICAEIAVGQYKGKKVLLPKIPLQSSDSEKNGIPFKRTQFPVKLCFAMTINKAQGQTLDYVGIYLREPVFSHGQLYVALSRARTSDSVKVLIVPPTFSSSVDGFKTRNVVFREILSLSNQ